MQGLVVGMKNISNRDAVRKSFIFAIVEPAFEVTLFNCHIMTTFLVIIDLDEMKQYQS